MKLDGKKLAAQVLEKLKTEVKNLKQNGITPALAVILIGDDENSLMYIRQKKLKAEEIGAQTIVHTFEPTISRAEIEELVKKLDSDEKIHGIILQRPAPHILRVDEIEESISPKKEVDGFGIKSIYPVPVAEAVWRLIELGLKNQEIKNKKISVLGKGETAGMPIISYLRKKSLEPIIVDSKTQNPQDIIKNSDVVISAVGKDNVINPKIMKKGAVLIGVGLHTSSEGKLKGDFDDEQAEETELCYSPTPGGVGPLNVACLMENLVRASKNE